MGCSSSSPVDQYRPQKNTSDNTDGRGSPTRPGQDTYNKNNSYKHAPGQQPNNKNNETLGKTRVKVMEDQGEIPDDYEENDSKEVEDKVTPLPDQFQKPPNSPRTTAFHAETQAVSWSNLYVEAGMCRRNQIYT